MLGPGLPRVVKYLIIANAVVFLWQLITQLTGDTMVIRFFGLTPYLVVRHLYLWQLVTYLFLHAGLFHILINMFVLWMFGSELERIWGERAFLKFYLFSGVAAGVLSVIVNPFSTIPTIGASGAVYGVLAAYGVSFPERYVYLYFLIPVKVKYFVAGLGLLAFLSALSAPGSMVAHIAHLGGFAFGFLYLKGWVSPSRLREKYYRWKLGRMRRKFRVYEQKEERKRRDDDFWIN